MDRYNCAQSRQVTAAFIVGPLNHQPIWHFRFFYCEKGHMSTKFLRLATLALLYFVQGAPYGFQTACLPLILREAGLSFTSLGLMKLLFVPWVRKKWLTFSLLSEFFFCLVHFFLDLQTSVRSISGAYQVQEMVAGDEHAHARTDLFGGRSLD